MKLVIDDDGSAYTQTFEFCDVSASKDIQTWKCVEDVVYSKRIIFIQRINHFNKQNNFGKQIIVISRVIFFYLKNKILI